MGVADVGVGVIVGELLEGGLGEEANTQMKECRYGDIERLRQCRVAGVASRHHTTLVGKNMAPNRFGCKTLFQVN
jgi:hypothetical protein